MSIGTRIAVSLVLALGACGAELGDPDETEQGSDGKGDDPMPTPTPALTATSFLGRIGMQYCDESFRCKATYPGGAAAFAQDFGATASECYADAKAFYMPELVEASIKANRIVFNTGPAKLCMDGVTYTQNCNVYWQTDPVVPAACAIVFIGNVPNGGVCTIDADCFVSTAICDSATKRCR